MITSPSLSTWYRPRSAAALVALAFLVATAPQARAQQSFSTAEEAAAALVSAARTGDRTRMLRVLGRDGADIVSSGDAVADANTRKAFLTAYDAKHRITTEKEGEATLIVGDDDFPFPIPLMRKDGGWQFDTTAGREEILFRRIGRNELSAIEVCRAYVDAQQEYAEKTEARGTYARRIVSQRGKRDGLYWFARPGEEESPLGEFVAAAAPQGYRAGQQRTPYHGYYYRILTSQGANAPGGAIDYLVRGKMIGGFALVAYPAEYANSGIMTFLINHQGIVYQKDLGPNTARLAARMRAFNPDGTWQRVTDVSRSESESPQKSQ